MRRTSNLQLQVGVQLLDSTSFKDALGADGEGLDRGSGEVGTGAQAGLWWTSTCADERMDDTETRTETGLHKLPFEKKFKILGYTSNQAGRTQDSLEERMHRSNKAWWRDVKIYRSKDVQGEENTEGWWSSSTVYSASGAKAGRGAERSWKEVKVGRQTPCGVCSDSKETRMKR